MTSHQELVDLEEIRRLKYRYLRGLDQKDWAEVASTLAIDATASYGGGSHELSGRDEVLGFLERTLGSRERLSSHRVSQPEIDFEGPDDASGIWALDDVVIVGDHGAMVVGAAFYEDRYVREDGEWVIAHTGYRRTYEQLIPLSDLPGTSLTASWWGTEGRSTLPAG